MAIAVDAMVGDSWGRAPSTECADSLGQREDRDRPSYQCQRNLRRDFLHEVGNQRDGWIATAIKASRNPCHDAGSRLAVRISTTLAPDETTMSGPSRSGQLWPLAPGMFRAGAGGLGRGQY